MDGVWPMCEGHQTEAQHRILMKLSLRKQDVQILHQTPAHHHTAGGPQAAQTHWLTHNRHLPERSLGGTAWRWKEEMFITHRFLQDERDWKEQKMGRWWWEATEVLEILRTRLKSTFLFVVITMLDTAQISADICFCCPSQEFALKGLPQKSWKSRSTRKWTLASTISHQGNI